jgi:hypothetical protein
MQQSWQKGRKHTIVIRTGVTTLFTNIRIFDGPPRARGSVLVEGDRIAKVAYAPVDAPVRW